MSSNKELTIRERVGNSYLENKQMKKCLIVNHFRFEGIPKFTIYSIINRVDNGISLDRKPGSGKSGRIDQKLKDKIIEENVSEIGLSHQSIGRKHGIHHKTAKIKYRMKQEWSKGSGRMRRRVMKTRRSDRKNVWRS